MKFKCFLQHGLVFPILFNIFQFIFNVFTLLFYLLMAHEAIPKAANSKGNSNPTHKKNTTIQIQKKII